MLLSVRISAAPTSCAPDSPRPPSPTSHRVYFTPARRLGKSKGPLLTRHTKSWGKPEGHCQRPEKPQSRENRDSGAFRPSSRQLARSGRSPVSARLRCRVRALPGRIHRVAVTAQNLKVRPSLTSLPLTVPPSHHSTDTEDRSAFTVFTVALWIKPGRGRRWAPARPRPRPPRALQLPRGAPGGEGGRRRPGPPPPPPPSRSPPHPSPLLLWILMTRPGQTRR